MAKRVIMVDEFGAVSDTLSASQAGDAREERAQVERWIVQCLAKRKAQFPDRRFIALEVQTRRGEYHDVLHAKLSRRRATVHWRPDGTPEVTDLAMPDSITDATPEEGGRPPPLTVMALAAPPIVRAWA